MTKIIKYSQIQKRIRRKANTQAFVANLIGHYGIKSNSPSTVANQYNKAHWCADLMIKHEDRLRTGYCKTRMCYICNAIRQANLINGYKAQLQPLIDKQQLYFVTLTQPTCHYLDAKKRIEEMGIWWRLTSQWKAKINRPKSVGIRKVEGTINYDNEHLHFHYHILIEADCNEKCPHFKQEKPEYSEDDSSLCSAHWTVNRWLKSHPMAKPYCQTVIQVKNKKQKVINPLTGKIEQAEVLSEMFKYMTKMVYKDKEKNPIYVPRGKRWARLFNAVFETFKGRRIIQPFGGLKKVSEKIEDAPLVAQEVKKLDGNQWAWVKEVPNYISEWGEVLDDNVKIEKEVVAHLRNENRDPPGEWDKINLEKQIEQLEQKNYGLTCLIIKTKFKPPPSLHTVCS